MANNRQAASTATKQLFTEEQVYNNQFITSEFVIEKKRWAIDNFSKEHTEIRLKGEIHRPSREQAEQMTKRTLCLYIASSSLRLRDIKGAISNAMCWYDHHTKEDILDTFFPATSQHVSL